MSYGGAGKDSRTNSRRILKMPIQSVKQNLEESPVLFLTMKIVNGLPVFVNRSYFDIVIKALRWYRRNKRIKIYAYTILINHLHLVVEFPDDMEGDKMIGDFKRYIAKEIIKKLKEDGRYDILEEIYMAANAIKKQDLKVWERNNWPISITSDKFFNQKVNYTDYNASHHRVVKDIEKWPYTSFHNHYCEHPCLFETDAIYD